MEAMQIVRLDFKLELGALEETVEVSSESQVLQTESATVGEVISGTTLTALPLNGRNTGQLVAAAARRGHAEPELVHRRSATSAAAARSSTGTGSRPTTTRSTAST